MGQASRQSQAQRFLDEFKADYDKSQKLVLPKGPWYIADKGIGMSDDGEIRHFISLKIGSSPSLLRDIDTGFVSLDVTDFGDMSATDVADHVSNVLEIDFDTARRRVINAGLFNESDF